MGWFDKQIKQRIQNDEEAFSGSFEKMARMVTGVSFGKRNYDNVALAQNAIEEILKYYHVKPSEVPAKVKDVHERLEYLLRPFGIMRRNITLKDTWYQDGIGPLLAQTAEGEPIALIPRGFSGYSYLDYKTGKRVKVTRKNAVQISAEAICFYKPFPLKKLGIRDLVKFLMQTLDTADFVAMGVATLAVTLLGLLPPQIYNVLFSTVVVSNNTVLLFAAMSMFVGAMFAILLFGILKGMVLSRISTKLSIAVESATMMRLLSLPAGFFKEYSSGNIGQRLDGMNQLADLLCNMLLSTGFTGLFSLIYIGQILTFTPALAIPALLVTLATLALSLAAIALKTKLALLQMEEGAKERGMMFALLSGIQKIKLAGAERRAFGKWTDQYVSASKFTYAPPTFLKLNGVILMAITSIGTIIFYYAAVKAQVGISAYMAFNASYGMVSGAFAAFSGVALSLANIKPLMDMVNPILKTLPEVQENKKVVARLSGGVELNNVCFRYKEDMPLILDNLSLKIRPGQYVAIVGRTGCGKSTLLRILLGFETPQKGAVYYDGKDLSTMDLRSLRRHMGVVIQNGKLFSGDIYSNITISAPNATLETAWEAAKMAGMDEDIRRMPMGMNTLISEGSGGISGGQRQRLLIARAIASKPKILLFDEATSALDNITQKIVSDSLTQLKCTRIVIAHRLSTIKDCDRIVMLEGGVIVEDGSYDELLEKGGKFAELVKRQQLN